MKATFMLLQEWPETTKNNDFSHYDDECYMQRREN
jgi:hypothetical protein